jgi:uncharacterized membrane protein
MRISLPLILRIIPYFVSMVLLWVFWSTAVSTSWARIAALQTIEPYAFAVHEQLLRNFSANWDFFQTVHRGYDDTWTWSGHRALTLPMSGFLYGMNPSALWLSKIMILFSCLGAIAAGGIGKRFLQHDWGFFWGCFVYVSAPAAMALALQDYQDLCFALPCIVIAFWAFGTGRWYLAVIGAIFAVAPREETIPMAVACAVLAIPIAQGKIQRKTYALNIVIGCLVAGFYVWWAEAYFPLASGGHDMPLQNAVGSLGHERIFLEGWLYQTRFYALVFIPLGMLAYLAPLTALPAVAICLLHMTVPDGHGVDRSWSGHCHHMAPAVAFSCIATIIGGSRLMRWVMLRRFGVWQWLPSAAILILSVTWASWWWLEWSQYYNLVVSITEKDPEWEHPAWVLQRELPDDAVPVASKNTALVVSSYLRSYTIDESIYSKERVKGLSAATHAIIDSRRSDVMSRLMAMEGAEIIAKEDPFVLVRWDASAVDLYVKSKTKFKRPQPYIGDFRKASLISGVPPRETKIAATMGSFPVLNLQEWRIE